MIITAAYTESRASAAFSAPPASIIETTSATSITVTATASTSVPKGSPTRWATTSAWCTAAITAPISAGTHSAASSAPIGSAKAAASSAAAAAGTSRAQSGIGNSLYAKQPAEGIRHAAADADTIALEPFRRGANQALPRPTGPPDHRRTRPRETPQLHPRLHRPGGAGTQRLQRQARRSAGAQGGAPGR